MGCAASSALLVSPTGVLVLSPSSTDDDMTCDDLFQSVVSVETVSGQHPDARLTDAGLKCLCNATFSTLTSLDLHEGAIPRITAAGVVDAASLIPALAELTLRGTAMPSAVLLRLSAVRPKKSVEKLRLVGHGVGVSAFPLAHKATPCLQFLIIEDASAATAWETVLLRMREQRSGPRFRHLLEIAVSGPATWTDVHEASFAEMCPKLRTRFPANPLSPPSHSRPPMQGGHTSTDDQPVRLTQTADARWRASTLPGRHRDTMPAALDPTQPALGPDDSEHDETSSTKTPGGFAGPPRIPRPPENCGVVGIRSRAANKDLEISGPDLDFPSRSPPRSPQNQNDIVGPRRHSSLMSPLVSTRSASGFGVWVDGTCTPTLRTGSETDRQLRLRRKSLHTDGRVTPTTDVSLHHFLTAEMATEENSRHLSVQSARRGFSTDDDARSRLDSLLSPRVVRCYQSAASEEAQRAPYNQQRGGSALNSEQRGEERGEEKDAVFFDVPPPPSSLGHFSRCTTAQSLGQTFQSRTPTPMRNSHSRSSPMHGSVSVADSQTQRRLSMQESGQFTSDPMITSGFDFSGTLTPHRALSGSRSMGGLTGLQASSSQLPSLRTPVEPTTALPISDSAPASWSSSTHRAPRVVRVSELREPSSCHRSARSQSPLSPQVMPTDDDEPDLRSASTNDEAGIHFLEFIDATTAETRQPPHRLRRDLLMRRTTDAARVHVRHPAPRHPTAAASNDNATSSTYLPPHPRVPAVGDGTAEGSPVVPRHNVSHQHNVTTHHVGCGDASHDCGDRSVLWGVSGVSAREQCSRRHTTPRPLSCASLRSLPMCGASEAQAVVERWVLSQQETTVGLHRVDVEKKMM